MKDPFGEARGKFEYSSLLTRLQKLKTKFESLETNEQQEVDPYTRKIINGVDSYDSKAKDEMSLDDIFDGNGEDDDDDDEEDDAE
jgi:hypothetical protein